ncbi:MAG: NAD(P)/FAD-dependent oxidoreductase [Chloroflexaceae bacterium]|jgi:NADH dehydrogenase|nr:NAD(P)/FAD-dependent oxidoreductase [Chloroflexaceae bacterium]
MNILILGAGYAGLRAALDLDSMLRERNGSAPPASITLLDQNPYHQLVQELHLTATAAIHTREAIIEFERILRRRSLVLLRQGRASRIEPLQRQVLLDDGTALAYDWLIIALGAQTSYGNVPGAREHSFALRTFDEAIRLRDHIRNCFAEAAKTSDETEKRRFVTVAIVGGGYTGCQFAGEMAAWAPQLSEEFGLARNEARIALLDRSPVLLKQFGQWATAEAERVLDRRGVSVYLNTAVERVEPGALYVSEGRVLRAKTIVWAGGIRGPALLAEAGLPTDQFGRVLVDRYLRVQNQARVFAAGDCAAIPDQGNGTVPATASYAMRQGSHMAETIVAELEGRAPAVYEPLKLGELVSLGPNDGVGDPLGFRVYGPPALLMKKGIEAWYRSTLE